LAESRDPDTKSELSIAAEKAFAAAQKMRPGAERLEALKRAGKLRNEAVLKELAETTRRSK
jgi:hypothetical protein